ncbi:hypothetical protein EPUL_002458, partial [Erysiphe pulchra]
MRTKKLFLDDKIMILAIVPLIARMCCETTVVTHGTNNVDTKSLTEAQIRSLVFPIPMVLMSGLLLKQKVNILLRLSLPLFPIVLTVYAIPALCGRDPFATSHIRRTLLVSIDVLLTAFSANAVILFSFLQDKGVKKSKFKHMHEGFHTNRFANMQRSHHSGSMEIANVELCDVGNLLHEGKLGNNIDGQNDSGTNQSSSKAGHQCTCLKKTNNNPPTDKKTILNTQENEMEQKNKQELKLGMDSNQCKRGFEDETNDQIIENSGQAKRYWKEKGSYSNSFSDEDNEIIPPSP